MIPDFGVGVADWPQALRPDLAMDANLFTSRSFEVRTSKGETRSLVVGGRSISRTAFLGGTKTGQSVRPPLAIGEASLQN
jgi:hypothetical protein